MSEDTKTQVKPAPKNLLKGIKRPKEVKFIPSQVQPNYGRFIAEPFHKGFATTIGNSLRRVLLSVIEGAAITAVKIEGVAHEFSTIPGVKEEVLEIILNLKKVRLKYFSSQPLTIDIEKRGPGLLLAEDLAIHPEIEVMNPELIIAHLNEDAHLKMSLQIQRGKGYLPVEESKKYVEEIGVIPIDAIFSPIRKVNFEVEPSHGDYGGEYERLILHVWTDGSIAPDDAVAYAAKILKEHLSIFINFQEEHYEEEEVEEIDQNLKKVLDMHVEELEFSVRTLMTLYSLDITHVRDLVKKREEELRQSKHFSEKVLLQIKNKLWEYGLKLGMKELRG